MKVLECLTPEAKEMILNYILYNEDEGACGDRASIDYILRYWDEGKNEYLFKLFGEHQLILNKQITYQRGREELFDDMESMLYGYLDSNDLHNKAREFLSAYRSLSSYGGPLPNNFYLGRLLDVDSLVDNLYDGDDFELKLPNDKVLKVPHGCKTMKMLGKIAQAYNIPYFEEFRQAHSQVLNQKTLKGNLCISRN